MYRHCRRRRRFHGERSASRQCRRPSGCRGYASAGRYVATPISPRLCSRPKNRSSSAARRSTRRSRGRCWPIAPESSRRPWTTCVRRSTRDQAGPKTQARKERDAHKVMTLADVVRGPESVLVTGASGFIGSAVVRALIDDGYRVRSLCEPGRDDDNLEGVTVERIVGDIRDPATLDDAVVDVSTVFHLAAIYRFWAAVPSLFYDVNVGGTMNVIRAAERAGCNRLVYTSTV